MSNNEAAGNPLGWIFPPLTVALLIGGAFWIGRLSAQVDNLKQGNEIVAGAESNPVPTVEAINMLSVENLKATAETLGVDKNKFNSCLDEGRFEQKVKDDLAYGGSLGVNGTPTFFINGIAIVGAQPQAQFEKIIEAELKDGSGDKVAGLTRKKVEYGLGFVKGGEDAKIKMVEFSDFECPYCERAEPTIEALMQKYGDRISLEYRHNPLPFHGNAVKAAEASECAGEQGKFWEMHEAIFQLMASNG